MNLALEKLKRILSYYFQVIIPIYSIIGYSLSFTSLKFKKSRNPKRKENKKRNITKLERNDNEPAKLKAEMRRRRRERKRGTESGESVAILVCLEIAESRQNCD